MKKLIALLICLTFAFSCLSVQAAAAGSRVKERILYYIDEEGKVISEYHMAFGYDEGGRLCKERMFDPDSESYGREFTYRYYPDGTLKSMTDRGGKAIRPGIFLCHYDRLGHLMEVQPYQYVMDIYGMFNDWGVCIGSSDMGEDLRSDVEEEYDSEGKITRLKAEYEEKSYDYDDGTEESTHLLCYRTCEYQYDDFGRISYVDEKLTRDNQRGEKVATSSAKRFFYYNKDGSYACRVSTSLEDEEYNWWTDALVEFLADGTPARCSYCDSDPHLWDVRLTYDEEGDVSRYESLAQSYIGERYEFEITRGPYGVEAYHIYSVDRNDVRQELVHTEECNYDSTGKLLEETIIWHVYGNAVENYRYEYVEEPCPEDRQPVMQNGKPCARRVPFIQSPYEGVS